MKFGDVILMAFNSHPARSRRVGNVTTDENWTVRELIPGPTAKRWARCGLLAAAVCGFGMAGALVCALTIVARTERLDPLTITFLALAGAGLLAASAFLWLSDRKQKAEVAAGYTTVAQGNNDVERLHSPTGVVMRAAGEPNLTKAQWEAAIAKVRSYRATGQRSPAALDSTQPASLTQVTLGPRRGRR